MTILLKTFILVLLLGGHSLGMWAFMTPGDQSMAACIGGATLGSGIMLFHINTVATIVEEVGR